jgi:hypothetical protein
MDTPGPGHGPNITVSSNTSIGAQDGPGAGSDPAGLPGTVGAVGEGRDGEGGAATGGTPTLHAEIADGSPLQPEVTTDSARSSGAGLSLPTMALWAATGLATIGLVALVVVHGLRRAREVGAPCRRTECRKGRTDAGTAPGAGQYRGEWAVVDGGVVVRLSRVQGRSPTV